MIAKSLFSVLLLCLVATSVQAQKLGALVATNSVLTTDTIPVTTDSAANTFKATTATILKVAGIVAPDTTQTNANVLGKLSANTVEATNGVTVAGVAVPTISSTSTLTNKRVTRRTVTVSDATTITANVDTSDVVYQLNTQSAGTLTIANPTGTPTDEQPLVIRWKCTNIQTLAFGSQFRFSVDLTQPATSTGNSKFDRMAFAWNAISTNWDCIAKNFGY